MMSEHADSIQWGGEVVVDKNRTVPTQMGSGHFAKESYRKASYICEIKYVNPDGNEVYLGTGSIIAQMSWNSQMDSQYIACPSPYDSAGSFVDFFAGLTYDHVNFIFSGSSQLQDGDEYSPVNMGYYKYGYSEHDPTQYYSNTSSYEVYDHLVGMDEYSRRDNDFPSAMTTEQSRTVNQQPERTSNTNIRTRNHDCPRGHHNSQEYQAIWQDNIDPDHMSYEELLELGETVGTHSRGLSHEQISLLPVSKFRCCFLRRKSRSERCVICQMEYKRGARLITLPCKHKYHLGCGTKWLNINKACPICYTEVSLSNMKKFKQPA